MIKSLERTRSFTPINVVSISLTKQYYYNKAMIFWMTNQQVLNKKEKNYLNTWTKVIKVFMITYNVPVRK